VAIHLRRTSGLSLAFVALLLSLPVSPAAAELRVGPEGFSVQILDAEGNPEVRAGSHPDRVKIDFKFEDDGSGTSPGDVELEMPPGLGGDPNAVPACPRQAHEEGEECPPESQIGFVGFGLGTLPVYLLEPASGQLAAFTSKAGLPIPFQLKLRTDDFGITFAAEGLSAGAPSEAHMVLWGIPADHEEGSPAGRRPFLTLPSTCGPLTFKMRARSLEENAQWLSASAETAPLSGCENLPFAPRLQLQLSNPIADSPTGVRMALTMPEEEEEGSELANAQLKDVSVEMPPGLTISPGGAAGLTACTDVQFGQSTDAEATCPASSRLGTVELQSPSLREPVTGKIYLGQQRGSDRSRLFVTAPGPGAVIKFVASLDPELSTGRMVATLHDLPQVGFGRIAMTLGGGPGGLLAAPLGCGSQSGVAKFVPYGGGPAVTSKSTVTIASVLPGLQCPGPLPFAPELLVSTSSHRAANAISLSTVIRRHSGEGLPARFSVTIPGGFSAALGAVELCPEPDTVTGSCPALSRVGTVRALIGSGPSPASLSGSVFLAGPYHHAPFSLVMALKAAIGPFDLGSTAFRATTQLDSRSGNVTLASDRLPSMVEGLPIRFQAIELTLDRPGLVHNPTSCRPHSLDVEIESQEGGVTTLSRPLRVSGCKHLGFKPRVRTVIEGEGPLHRDGGIGLRISALLRRHDASLRSLALSMPAALELHVGELKEICSQVDARRASCPPGAKVGTTQARTPLFAEPLRGSAYVVQPRDDGPPDIWVMFRAGGVQLSMRGTTANDHGRFVTTLTDLPDMPLSSFSMRLGTPGKSLLTLSTSPCEGGRPRRLRAGVQVVGQNGAKRSSLLPILMKAGCISSGRQ